MVEIVEKPECVSWDSIHDVIWESHAANRSKGIIMSFPSLPGDAIKAKLGDGGHMLIALENGNVVGTAALKHKNASTWFGRHDFGYCCFDAVLPSYSGKGIYKRLCTERESMARAEGLDVLMFDTHRKNSHLINIHEKNGFRKVGVKRYGDHYNFVMVKWLDGCPYSKTRLFLGFMMSVARVYMHR